MRQADGTYFTVMYNDEGWKMPILAVSGIRLHTWRAIVGLDEWKMPILAVSGIRTTGEREVLAFCVGDRENQPAWEELLENLKHRGVKDIGLWVSDGNQATLNLDPPQYFQSMIY